MIYKKALDKDQIVTVLMTKLQEVEASRALENYFSSRAQEDGDLERVKRHNAEHANHFFRAHFLAGLIYEILGKRVIGKHGHLDKFDLLTKPSEES